MPNTPTVINAQVAGSGTASTELGVRTSAPAGTWPWPAWYGPTAMLSYSKATPADPSVIAVIFWLGAAQK